MHTIRDNKEQTCRCAALHEAHKALKFRKQRRRTTSTAFSEVSTLLDAARNRILRRTMPHIVVGAYVSEVRARKANVSNAVTSAETC